MKKQTKPSVDKPKTVTCNHCRYERPAHDEHCHICGYPWPFAVKSSKRPVKKATAGR